MTSRAFARSPSCSSSSPMRASRSCGGFVGVDVFFVLSGFLITGLLLARAPSKGRVSLVRFYVRRARRILPAAALTLVATMVAAHHLLNFVRARERGPRQRLGRVLRRELALRRVGRRLLRRRASRPRRSSTSGRSRSRSSSISSGRRCSCSRSSGSFGAAGRARLLLVIGVVGAASLAWSIHSTPGRRRPPRTSRPRAGLGARARRGARGRSASACARADATAGRMGWAGLAGIGCAAALFSSATPFPGYAALLPRSARPA